MATFIDISGYAKWQQVFDLDPEIQKNLVTPCFENTVSNQNNGLDEIRFIDLEKFILRDFQFYNCKC